jgi:glycosyltransferase involved in cell wall biosynthesis
LPESFGLVRVLLLHNRYRSLGGEERAVAETAALLRRHGHSVTVLERASAGIGRVRAARSLLAGGEDADEVARLVLELRADVVHAHNLHPLFGWRTLAAARGAGARTVLHLHNFRLFCSIGVAFRDGEPCHECQGRNTLPGLRHRCRGPVTESAVYAAALRAQQPRLLDAADQLVVLSHAHGDLLHGHGLSRERISVVPNFVTEFADESLAGHGRFALVAGRLVEEKGVDTAIRAAIASGVPLVVAGEGPDEARLRALAGDADVRFTGWLEPDRLARLRSGAAMVLAPSRCEEACPFAVLEALAGGVPVLVSDRGGLPEMVGDAEGGFLPAEDLAAWASAVASLWADPERRRSRGEAAARRAREAYGEDSAYAGLMRAYAGTP